MAKIYKYKKITDKYTTHTLLEPDYELLESEEQIVELCTIIDWVYVSVPDSIGLPEQPEIITDTLTEIDIDNDEETISLIKANAPAYENIRNRVVDKIRERYTLNDEIKMLRIGGDSEEIQAYNDYVEECREWGRDEKAKLGL